MTASVRRDRLFKITPLGPVVVMLAGSVEVGCTVAVSGPDGADRIFETLVEFPDDVRSLLEAFPWRGELTIREIVARVATAHLGRVDARRLLSTSVERPAAAGGATRRFRVSTSELRVLLPLVAYRREA